MNAKYYLAALILSFGSLNADASPAANPNEVAIETAKSLIGEDWHNTKAHNDLGEAYLKLGNLKGAEKEFKSALETDPVYSIGPFMFGDVRTDAERYQSKIEDFKKVIAQNEEYARSHHNLGTVYLAQNNLEIAKNEYEEALRINPKYAQAHNGLGLVYEDLGQKDKSMEQFELALAIDENNVVANYNIGLSYQDINDLNNSIFYLAKARELYKQRKNSAGERYLSDLIAHMEKTYVRPANETPADSIELGHSDNVLTVSVYEEPKTQDSSQSDSFKNINWDESVDSDDISLTDENSLSENAIQSAESTIVKSESVYGPHMEETSIPDPVTNVVEIDKGKEVQPETAPIIKEAIAEGEPAVKILKVQTSGGEFLGNSRVVPSVSQRSELGSPIDTDSLSNSAGQTKLIAKKGPMKKQDEPFVGDWLFEYQNK